MTARELYEALLIELNKVEAPSLLLEDYNYFLNKSIREYVNRRYVLYDTSQQTTDDLQVLTDTVKFSGAEDTDPPEIVDDTVQLPDTYFHLLNCIVKFKVKTAFKIYPKDSIITQGARRLTADKVSIIQNNAFLKPEYRRPYYYIKNIKPTNPSTEDPQDPISNPTNIDVTVAPKLEIRAGNYDSALSIDSIEIDYLKTPEKIVLTEAQRDNLKDTSQILEFPDYVGNEIIKNLVVLVLENASDERTEGYPKVNTSIPQQVQPQQGGQAPAPQENLQQR